MSDCQRITFSFTDSEHPTLAQWLARHPHGKRSQAIVQVLEQRGQVPEQVQIMDELRAIHQLVEELPAKLTAQPEAEYEPS